MNFDRDNEIVDLDEECQTHAKDEAPYVVSQKDHICELKIGMLAYSSEEAFELYNHYALGQGFSVQKGKVRYYDGTREVRQHTFLCSCEGFREDVKPYEERKFDRVITRTGCNARVIFNVKNGVYEISQLISEHNHLMAKSEHKHLLRCGRKISNASVSVITSITNIGIRATKAYSYLANEAGGVRNVGFTERDCHNFLQSERAKLIEAGDAQSVFNYFKLKQIEEPMFFYTVQVDDQNRMTNFYWRDSMSKIAYHCFGDIVIFDTTYRTNKYNMICAPFVAVNHHWKNVFLGCAFLLDETTGSFIWLFEAFLQSMDNIAPKTIFTDQDQAMANTIAKVLPNTHHRLCNWHISKNAAQNISTLYAQPRFKNLFGHLLHGCESEDEFEYIWNKMKEEFNVAGNKWLSKLYDLREKWCPGFSRDIFSANHFGSPLVSTHNIATKALMVGGGSEMQLCSPYLGRPTISIDANCALGNTSQQFQSSILCS